MGEMADMFYDIGYDQMVEEWGSFPRDAKRRKRYELAHDDFVWIDQTGKHWKLAEMNTDHVIGAMVYLEKHGKKDKFQYKYLKSELDRRISEESEENEPWYQIED